MLCGYRPSFFKDLHLPSSILGNLFGRRSFWVLLSGMGSPYYSSSNILYSMWASASYGLWAFNFTMTELMSAWSLLGASHSTHATPQDRQPRKTHEPPHHPNPKKRTSGHTTQYCPGATPKPQKRTSHPKPKKTIKNRTSRHTTQNPT